MATRLDIIIFGATGFTGKYAVSHAYKVFKKVAWGVAGRNENKLKQVLRETAKSENVTDFKQVPIIIADVDDEESIRNMTRQAKIIINCCGPFQSYGEVVIKCCIETGTHYVDISGEELFIRDMVKYQESAEENGVYIVTACGFCCVPHDLGLCFLEKEFKGTLNSAEIYLNAPRGDGYIHGPTVNYTSWISAINIMSKYTQLKSKKKQFLEMNNMELKPKLATKLPHKFDGLALPFPGADQEITNLSQLFFYKYKNKRPIQIRNYIIMPSISFAIIMVIFGVLCFILAQFVFGRKLLLKYPGFFSYGISSRGTPAETINQRRFSLTFKCRGWANEFVNIKCNSSPNKEIIGRISGINPGYGSSGLAAVVCALMILTEPHNLPARGGVYTPAAAFSETSLNEQLQKNGLKYEILSITDLE